MRAILFLLALLSFSRCSSTENKPILTDSENKREIIRKESNREIKASISDFLIKFVASDSSYSSETNRTNALLKIGDLSDEMQVAGIQISDYDHIPKDDISFIIDASFNNYKSTFLFLSDTVKITGKTGDKEKSDIGIQYLKFDLEKNTCDVVLLVYDAPESGSIELFKIKYDAEFNLEIVTRKVIAIS